MKLNIRLGQISLVTSIIFVLIIGLQYVGFIFDVSLYFFVNPLNFFFGPPLYFLIFISFIYTGYTWIINRNKNNFRYFIYTCVAGFIVVGTLLILLISLASVMSKF